MGRRGPVKRKGAPTGVRLESELRAQLEQSAEVADRSLSEEITSRLKASFGSVEFRDPATALLVALISDALDNIIWSDEGCRWHESQRAFERAQEAIDVILQSLEPGGSNEVPDDHPTLQRLRMQGISEDIVLATKAELAKPGLGRRAGFAAITRCEMVAAGKETPVNDHYRGVAETAKRMLATRDESWSAINELYKIDVSNRGDFS